MNCKDLKYIPLSVLLIALVQLISCTPQACQEETLSKIKATFYVTGTNKIQAPDSLTVYGLGIHADTNKIYNKSSKISIAQIPLNPSAGTCGFVFRINGITDTLNFTYASYPHLISKECGFTYYHILDSYTVTGNAIDTIIFMNKNITTINEENIRIFY
jgi:hypothetical protein